MVRRNAFLIAYLAIQVLLPLRGIHRNRLEARGFFSWNMFSQMQECDAWWDERRPDGSWGPLRVDPFLNMPARVGDLFNAARLRRFHAWLCQGRDVRASVSCSIDHGPRQTLVPEGASVCAAPNWGVRSP